jgi:hypothetical protein
VSRIPGRFNFITLITSNSNKNYQAVSAFKYYSNDKNNEVKTGRIFSAHGNVRVTYRILVGKTECDHLGDTGIEVRTLSIIKEIRC